MVIWIKSIRRKLFYVSLGQSSEFSLSQALSEVQQSLWEKTSATVELESPPHPAHQEIHNQNAKEWQEQTS